MRRTIFTIFLTLLSFIIYSQQSLPPIEYILVGGSENGVSGVLTDALTDLNNKGTITIKGNVTITGNIEIPEGIILRFFRESKLIINPDITLTINGMIDAGNFRIFDVQNETYDNELDDGKIIFSASSQCVVNIEWFRHKNIEADNKSINRAINSGSRNVVAPINEQYVIRDKIIIPSNISIDFKGSKITSSHGKLDSFLVESKENIIIKNIKTIQSAWGGNNFNVQNSKNVRIKNVEAQNITNLNNEEPNIVLISNSDEVEVNNLKCDKLKWGKVIQVHQSNGKNIKISNIKSILEKDSEVIGVYLTYSSNIIVENISCEGGRDCIHWFGGEADPTKANYNPNAQDGINNIKIQNVTARGMRSGVWGSRGKNISVTDCLIDKMYDVGLDVEGGENVRFSNFIVKNCDNSALATFYSPINIIFENGHVIQDDIEKYVKKRDENGDIIESEYRAQGALFNKNCGETIIVNVIFENKTNRFIDLILTHGDNQNIRISNSTFINGGSKLQGTFYSSFTNNYVKINNPDWTNPIIYIRGGLFNNIESNIIRRTVDNTNTGLGENYGAIVIDAINNSNFKGEKNIINSNRIYGFKVALFDRCFLNKNSFNRFINNIIDLDNSGNFGGCYIYINQNYYGLWEGNRAVDSLSLITPNSL